MGSSKDRLIELEIEKARRQDQLPDSVDDALRLIGELQDDLRGSYARIEELHDQLCLAGTWKAKLKDWILGGIVGAAISLLLA